MTTWFTKTTALASAFAAMALMTGCATTTVSPEARSAYDKTQQSLKAQPVSIVSDACVLLVEMGQDDIMYQHSNALPVAMANTLKDSLNKQGVTVNHLSSPFVCGAMTQKELLEMDILATEDAKDVPNTDYPILSTNNAFDNVTNQAYLNLYKALVNVRKESAESQKTGTNVPLNLDTASLNKIRQTENSDKVFVLLAAANKQSFGLRFVAASTSPLAGALINRAPGSVYSIHLVNLKTNQVQWNNSGLITTEVFKSPVTGTVNTKDKILSPLYAE